MTIKNLFVALAILFTGTVVLATPVGAQGTTKVSNLGQEVKTCNQTYEKQIKAVQQDLKASKITKTERNSKLKELKQTKLACIKEAQKIKKEVKKNTVELKTKKTLRPSVNKR